MRTYDEILHDVNFNDHTPKELRKIHKELKQYGDGIFFTSRYPDFPLYFCACSFVLTAALVVLSMVI